LEPRWWTPGEIAAFTLLAENTTEYTDTIVRTSFQTAALSLDSNNQIMLLHSLNRIRANTAWDNFYFGYVEEFAGLPGLGLTVTYRPVRYRFVFVGAPPLRHFQRNDGLGMGAPRQINRSSRQRSLRQGPRTYR